MKSFPALDFRVVVLKWFLAFINVTLTVILFPSKRVY